MRRIFASLVLCLFTLASCCRGTLLTYETSLTIGGQSALVVNTDGSSLAAAYAARAALSAGTIIHNSTAGSITGGTFTPVLDGAGDVAGVARVTGLLGISGTSFGTPVTAHSFGVDAATGAWRIWTQADVGGVYQVIGQLEPQSWGLANALTQLNTFDLADQFGSEWGHTPLVQNGAVDFFLVTTPSVRTVPEPASLLVWWVCLMALWPKRRIGCR